MKFSDNEILHLDNHLLIVNKPPLLLTLPTLKVKDSVLTRAQETIREIYKKKGNVFVHPVHRLDRVASGIVVSAKTSKALSRLNEQIKEGGWKKTYVLRFEGKLPSNEGTLRHYLEKGDYHTKVVEEGKGKEAVLHYRKTSENKAEVDLITGRYHQIRAQFSHIGCPICGDRKYGAKTKGKQHGIDLHHKSLVFKHPILQELLTINSLEKF